MRGWRGAAYPGEFPTLGHGVLAWLYQSLPSPGDATGPLVLTDEQALFILRWYALDPPSGRFLYRRGALEMAKGWGKSPLAAAVAIAEFAGPVLFDGWDANGDPVGKPWGTGDDPSPWVQVAAVSEDQTENTYGAIYAYLTANDGRSAAALGIDQGRTRLYLKGRPGRLEPVTASAGSREGQRLTFAVLDETHLWDRRNGGIRLANTLRRNVAKMQGRTLETTNAPTLGGHSVAEATGQDAEAGEPGVLHVANRPSAQPMPDDPPEKQRQLLAEVYGDARWIDLERIIAEVADPATPWDDALRYYFNVRSTGAGRAVDPRRWDALAEPRDVPEDTYIGVGFDGSISQDATVLRGCTADGYSWLIRKWERPPDAGPEWMVDRIDVHETVVETFSRYRVGMMLADPPKWWTEIERWQQMFGATVVVQLDTNQARRFAPAVDRWLTAIREGSYRHDGDPFTRRHVISAHLRAARVTELPDGRTPYVLVRGEDNARIDAAVADVLAYQAAMSMPTERSIYDDRGLQLL